MKISDIRSGRPASPTKRSGKTESGKGGEFARELERLHGEPAPADDVRESGRVSGVGAVLSAQEAGDATEREARRNLVRRGEDLLDRLDEIRLGLLEGRLSKSQLMNLAQMVRARRRHVDDPQLVALIDEIELRAEVEIAKWSRSG